MVCEGLQRDPRAISCLPNCNFQDLCTGSGLSWLPMVTQAAGIAICGMIGMQLEIHCTTCVAAFIKMHQRHETTQAVGVAQEEVIRARVEKRAKHTGRSIPEDKLKASIAAVERCGVEKCCSGNV